jgi:hypothetical protein
MIGKRIERIDVALIQRQRQASAHLVMEYFETQALR